MNFSLMTIGFYIFLGGGLLAIAGAITMIISVVLFRV